MLYRPTNISNVIYTNVQMTKITMNYIQIHCIELNCFIVQKEKRSQAYIQNLIQAYYHHSITKYRGKYMQAYIIILNDTIHIWYILIEMLDIFYLQLNHNIQYWVAFELSSEKMGFQERLQRRRIPNRVVPACVHKTLC